jgi:hypothetical protein
MFFCQSRFFAYPQLRKRARAGLGRTLVRLAGIDFDVIAPLLNAGSYEAVLGQYTYIIMCLFVVD